MIPLYTEEEYSRSKCSEKLSLKCAHCNNAFYREKRFVTNAIKYPELNRLTYCSVKCARKARYTGITSNCGYCDTKIYTQLKEFKKSKSGKNFCSNSCAAKYNNRNKKTGTRRSKMEVYIEEKLRKDFPNMNIHYNRFDALETYELDFYFPDLELAIEINGIYHYKPIHGEKKLNRIKSNDKAKQIICEQKGINLISIDISKINKFTPEKGDYIYNKYIQPLIQ